MMNHATVVRAKRPGSAARLVVVVPGKLLEIVAQSKEQPQKRRRKSGAFYHFLKLALVFYCQRVFMNLYCANPSWS